MYVVVIKTTMIGKAKIFTASKHAECEREISFRSGQINTKQLAKRTQLIYVVEACINFNLNVYIYIYKKRLCIMDA